MNAPATLVINLDALSLSVAMLDDEGVELGSASGPIETLSPQPGWLEQRPDDWWAALQKAVAGLDVGVLKAVKAVRLTGLTGVVVLDGEGDVIRPAIIAGDERLRGGAASAMSWLRQHQTIAYKRVQHLLTPLSYIRYRLSGEFAIDPADAETTGLFDAIAGAWSATKCDDAETNMDVLPAIRVLDERTQIATDAARALYLRDGVTVL